MLPKRNPGLSRFAFLSVSYLDNRMPGISGYTLASYFFLSFGILPREAKKQWGKLHGKTCLRANALVTS